MADRMWDEGSAAWHRLARRRRADALEALSDIGQLRRLLDRAELDAVRDARGDRRSWAEIATRLGITRQSAWERWRDLDTDPAPARASARTATVTVPDVCGLTWGEAQSALVGALLYGISDDPLLPPFERAESSGFVVIEQKPAAGEQVQAHSTVTLWLRRGPGSAGVTAPLEPPPTPRVRGGAVDEQTGESVR